jgi:hypothetical protein
VKPCVFHPEAGEELKQAVDYYAAIRPELGDQLNSEIARLVREVGENPRRFPRFRLPARRALSRRFPYSVVYLEQPDRVWILL